MKDLNQRLKDIPNPDHVKQKKCSVMFVAYVNQGEGCKYMISCGETLWELEASTCDEAVKELKTRVIGEVDEDGDLEDGYWGESKLEDITLFEIINREQMPLDKWYSEGQEIMDNKEIATKEQAEKIQLKHLKEKYE